ncbi:MAG: hypothetical protein ACOYT7_01665 [Patescibacteria group bacterium]
MIKIRKDADSLIHLLFIMAILILISSVLLLQRQIGRINAQLASQGVEVSSGKILFGDCGSECKKEIKRVVADAIATIAAVPKTIIKTQSTSLKTSYVPLDGTVTTTSTAWVDAAGVEVAFDLRQDYGENARVSWEASLKVAHANGTAYARLYDATHGIPVLGSEISTTNNSSFVRVASGNLNLWSGRNTYKVQLKSLNSFEITYTGGRIKVFD